MKEIKEIAKVNFKYNGADKPKYLFLNTYDNSVYIGGSSTTDERFEAPEITNVILDEEPEYFEEDATLIEEIKLPNNNKESQNFSIELVFFVPSLNLYIKSSFGQSYYATEGLMQDFNFNKPYNLTGGFN
ncbi:hypothetical protein QI034_07740 [Staphylococcus saprophyticus]|nr:hypothetical protein [Staphylococcus saprophyticus]MDW4523752.1 hypothetical protein [Staphylococcus saprophyticus]